MGKPNPLNSSSGFHRGRRKDTRKGLVSSTSSRRNTCKNKKCKTIRRRRHCRKHITRKISGGGSGELFVVVKYNDNEKPNDFKFEIDRIEYPGGNINWKKGKSVPIYRELVEVLKGVSGNMGSSKPVASYTPGGPSSGQGTGGPGVGANNGYSNSYGSMTNNSYGMSNNANSKSTTPLVNTVNNNVKNNGKNISKNGPKNNLDLVVDRIDKFVKDPNTKEAAKKLLANMDKVKIDPSVWSNIGKFFKKNGINISTEEEKNIKDSSTYEVGDVIVSYKAGSLKYSEAVNNKNILEEKSNLLNIGRILFKENGVKYILKHSDESRYEIDFDNALDSSKFFKVYNVDLYDDEIKKIQEQFDRIDYKKMPHQLSTTKDIVDIVVDIIHKKKYNILNKFNIEDFVDTQYLKDAAATGTMATKGTIPIDGKDTTSLIDMTAAANPGTIASTSTKASSGITASPTNTPKESNNIKILTMLLKEENKSYLDKIINKVNKGGNKQIIKGGGRNDGFEIAMAMVLLLDDDDGMDNNTGEPSLINTLNVLGNTTKIDIKPEDVNTYVYTLIFNEKYSIITEKSPDNKLVKIIDYPKDNNAKDKNAKDKNDNIIEIAHIENNDQSEELKLLLLERLCLEIDSIIHVIKTEILIKQIDGIKTFIDTINAQIDIYNTNSEKFNHLQNFWKEIKTYFNDNPTKYKSLTKLSEDKIKNNFNVFEKIDENINVMTNFYKENIREKSLYTKNISYKKLAENLNINLKKSTDIMVKGFKKGIQYTVILLKPLTKIDELSDVDTKAKQKNIKIYEKYFSNTSLTDTVEAYTNKLTEGKNVADNNKNITKIIENINNEKNKISETINNYNNETLKDKNSWFKYFSKERYRPIKRILGDKTAIINKHLDDMNRNMKYLWTIKVHEDKIQEVIKKTITSYEKKTTENVEKFTKFLKEIETEIDKLDDKDLIKQEYKKQFLNISKTQNKYRNNSNGVSTSGIRTVGLDVAGIFL